MFNVGDKVVHPGGGACIIQDISEKMLPGCGTKTYYTLVPQAEPNMTMMVPVENAERIGIRRPLTSDAIDILMDTFPEMDSSWISDRVERHKYYVQLFKDNTCEGLHGLMQTLKMLLYREPTGKLSFEDREMLHKIEAKAVSELAMVKELGYDTVQQMVRGLCREEEVA